MNKYTGVDIISLDDQKIISQKNSTNILSIKKDDDQQKKYSLILQNGKIQLISFFVFEIKFN